MKLDKVHDPDIDFAKWYTSIVMNANLIAYGVTKGTIILKPYSYSIWESIQKILDKKFKKFNIENVYLPTLIPKSLFQKEKNHIEGFSPECFTVTKIGDKKIPTEFYLRPTSETLFGNFFANEVKTYRDLPIKYNQWCNVFRAEKTTRPFLRTSEFLWQEGHTLHENCDEAQDMAFQMIKVYARFIEKTLLIPTIIGKKTEKEKFAGAITTYTVETLMYDGQALQTATSHYFGNTFSKTFHIQFLNNQNKFANPFATSWGVSTRLIGAIIMSHSDKRGLMLPSAVAKHKVAIVIVKNDPKLLEVGNNLVKLLKKYNPLFDISNKSFGYKASQSEIMGIPIRIEIGLRDIANNNFTIVRRDGLLKKVIIRDKILKTISQELCDYNKSLFNRAKLNNKKRIKKIQTFADYCALLKKGNFIALVPFCGEIKCENEINKITSTNSRCHLLNDSKLYLLENKVCFKCGTTAKHLTYFARAY